MRLHWYEMDILSSVIALIRLRTVHCGGFDLGPDACVQVPASDGVKFYAVVSGQCWLTTEWNNAVRKLEENDCVLLPKNKGFRLSASKDPSEVMVFSEDDCGKISTYNGGTACLMLGTHFAFSGPEGDLLMQRLPSLIHFARMPDQSKLRWLVDSLADEFQSPQAGGVLVTQHLAQLIFVQAIRACMESQQESLSGWLGALPDSRMSQALNCMYEKPGKKWTVEALGRLVGMSRAAFARRFTELTGESPMDHLTRWRMALASQRLSGTQQTVAEIAISLGYDSPSAFTKSFRRNTGKSPRDLRHTTVPSISALAD